MQVHGYPYDAGGSHVHRRDDTRRSGARPASTRHAEHRRSSPPGDSDEYAIERMRGDLRRRCSTATSVHWPTTPGGSTSRPCATSAGTTRTSCCSATPRTPPTSPSARAPSSRWRTPSRSPPACTSTRRSTAALAAYEAERKPVVVSTQRAAQASLEWFENLGQYVDQDPAQFAFNLLTRRGGSPTRTSQLRDPEFVAASTTGSPAARRRHQASRPTAAPPMFQPFRLGDLELDNRIVVSPMDMYSADRRDAERLPPRPPRRQGARRRRAGDDRDGLRLAEPAGSRRAAPASGTTSSATAWRPIVEFVHAESTGEDRHPDRPLRPQGLDAADVGGHGRARCRQATGRSSGRRRCRTAGVNQVPRELIRAELAEIRDEFVAAARRAAEAGFDLLELHCAHGYLLSSFLSPSPTGAPTSTAARWPAGCASRSRSSTRSAPSGRTISR